MNAKRELNDLLNACLKHFDEFNADVSQRIRFFSITHEDRDIWGGNGNLDTTETIYITRNGWLSETITSETGMYQRSNPIKKKMLQNISNEDVEEIMNGRIASMSDIVELVEFYNNVRKNHIHEFKFY